VSVAAEENQGQDPKVANVILLGVGALLLADAQRALGDVSAWSLMMPIVLVAVGATVLWKGVATAKLRLTPRDGRFRLATR